MDASPEERQSGALEGTGKPWRAERSELMNEAAANEAERLQAELTQIKEDTASRLDAMRGAVARAEQERAEAVAEAAAQQSHAAVADQQTKAEAVAAAAEVELWQQKHEEVARIHLCALPWLSYALWSIENLSIEISNTSAGEFCCCWRLRPCSRA